MMSQPSASRFRHSDGLKSIVLLTAMKRAAGGCPLSFAPPRQSCCSGSGHFHPQNWPFPPFLLAIFAPQSGHSEAESAVAGGAAYGPLPFAASPLQPLCRRSRQQAQAEWAETPAVGLFSPLQIS